MNDKTLCMLRKGQFLNGNQLGDLETYSLRAFWISDPLKLLKTSILLVVLHLQSFQGGQPSYM